MSIELESKQKPKKRLGMLWRAHGWEMAEHPHPADRYEEDKDDSRSYENNRCIECLTVTFENIASGYKEAWPAQRLNNHVSGKANIFTSVPMDVITDFLKKEAMSPNL